LASLSGHGEIVSESGELYEHASYLMDAARQFGKPLMLSGPF
jgi:hypothetical protein